jgi:hypothetical protein
MRVDALDGIAGVLQTQMVPPALNWWEYDPELAEMTAAGQLDQIDPILLRPRSPRTSPLRYASGGRGVDLSAVTKLLDVGQNKLRILKLLRRSDWLKILALMPKELLVNALRLFNKAKLMRLVMMLPKKILVKMLLQVIKMEDLIKKMPTVELMGILRSNRLNNRELVKGLQKMDPQFVLLLLQRIHGNYDYSKLKPYEIAQIFMQTDKRRLMEGFKTLPFKVLQPFVTGFVKNDPELLMSMSDAFVFKLFDRMPKPTLLQACMVLPNDMIIKMLSQLPDQLMMLAAAQVDDQTLEQYLITQHPDLLQALAGVA